MEEVIIELKKRKIDFKLPYKKVDINILKEKDFFKT